MTPPASEAAAGRPAGDGPEPDAPPRGDLRADCVADSAGGLTFDLPDPGGSRPAQLLLRLRQPEEHPEPAEEVRLPLAPAADGRLRAALPSGVALAEGRWDAWVQTAGQPPGRLTTGVNDLRSLIDRVPGGSRGHVGVRIPYATKHGNLTVRSWHRAPHAEAGELRIDGTTLTVRGRVYGAALGPGAGAELAVRGSGTAVGVDLAVEQHDFSLAVDYADLARKAPPGVWDLWLLPGGPGADAPRVRVARLLDDVADKKAIFTYPVVRLTGLEGPVHAGPYYTLDNDLSVRITATR